MSRAQVAEWPFVNRAIDVEAGREQISIEYEKGVVSRRFDHGGHDGVPVETGTKENPRLIFTALWPPFLKNVRYCKG